ncbi:phage tail protein [Pseudomonas sp. 13B_2.1_Bac1]|uniref:phage tail-collar fiber domain-containing protein n=1 Tax=Pseudomonas sp. 13B_2.1_Bac1 TaxID=2971624 RepID=UPI0021C5BF06|nr:phage tail protein [Pseudomonas sp. 13B_2.1_Bac1]MCU1781176.1 phage tail protein [Pseudomonas sp. 13B_2.1_Bac1]
MADYYTLLTNAGIAYETACKAAGVPIKLAQISVGDGNGAVYNPDASAKALKREVWRGPLNALFQDEKNANWLMAEVTIPSDVGGWYVREAGLWTDTGILYAIVKYPESYKPVLATSGSGKEFYIRSIFETSNASIVTLLIDDTVVKATRAWVMDYLGRQLAEGTYTKAEIETLIAQSSALPVGSMVAFPVDKVPVGFLEIDGSVKSASAYPDLAKFLGAAFNKGDEGAGNFRLPESRGEFLRGGDHGRGVDAGRVVGSYQSDAVQNVTGNFGRVVPVGDAIKDASGPFQPGDATGSVATGSNATLRHITFDLSRSARTAAETRPRNLAVLWCIKAWNAPINQGNIDIAALVSELDALKSAVPVGSIVPFPKAAVPPGYLELDGSVQSIAAYPDLARYLGTTFNTGSEAAGFFRLPESRGEFLRGWDHGRGIDAGRDIGTAQKGSLQTVDSTITTVTVTGLYNASVTPESNARTSFGLDIANPSDYPGAAYGGVAGSGGTMAAEGNNFGVTRPRNLAVMWCIKAWNAPVNQGTIDVSVLASQATETNQGTAKTATQPQADAGVDDATIVTPKKMRFGFAMNFTAASGYVLFPTWLGGLLIQYGRASLAADQFTTLTWPLAWPDACYAISGAVHSSLARVDDGISAQYRSLTKTTVILDRQDIGTAVANNRDMFVIGIGK